MQGQEGAKIAGFQDFAGTASPSGHRFIIPFKWATFTSASGKRAASAYAGSNASLPCWYSLQLCPPSLPHTAPCRPKATSAFPAAGQPERWK